MVRLAVAAWPPARVMEVIGSLDRPALSDVRWSTPEQWLVKLRPLGHVDEGLVPELVAALMNGLAGRRLARCRVGLVTRRIGGDWLGAPVTGLEALASAVLSATEPIVPVTHPQPFRADLVLARGRVPAELAGRPIEAAWTARSVSLVADRSSPHAVRLEDLAEFGLRG